MKSFEKYCQVTPQVKDEIIRKVGRCFEMKVLEGEDGSGLPKGRTVTLHYYIEQLKNGTIALELVDEEGNPTGVIVAENLGMEEFSSKFKSCSEHECPLQTRTIDEIVRKMSDARARMGEDHFNNGEMEKAENKFCRSLLLNDKNIQAQVGLGKAKMELEKVDEAMDIFEEISHSNEIFEQANKHTFNDFGIYLRKKEVYDLAVANYERGIIIDPFDEILYYNLGRVYWEMEELQTAIEKLKEGLKIAEGKKLKFIEGLAVVRSESEPGADGDEEYLKKTLQIAKSTLASYLTQEKTMLEGFFGRDTARESNEDICGALRATNTLMELLSQSGLDIDLEQKLSARNQLENIQDELNEKEPDSKRIKKWMSKLEKTLADLDLDERLDLAINDLFKLLKDFGRKRKLDL